MKLPKGIRDSINLSLGSPPTCDIDSLDWECDEHGYWCAEFEGSKFKCIFVPGMACYAIGIERKKEYGIGAV